MGSMLCDLTWKARGMRQGPRLLCAVLLLAGLLPSGCTTHPPAAVASCDAGPAGDDTVTVISRGWHTELGVPASRLRGGLAVFRRIFPGARTVMFGYGKRTFMTAPPDDAREYLLGPFPGPAVIEAIGLSTDPGAAYGRDDSVTLALPAGGDLGLSTFIANDLAKDSAGAPLLVGPGRFKGSLFYAARSPYSLTHTCNSWVAAALRAAGLPVSAQGVVFSGQVMARAATVSQCRSDRP
jgi:hypothetical protein